MRNTMIYKGFLARVEYSDEDRCFIGHLRGVSDVVGFHAVTVTKLRAAFEEAVDDYLKTRERTRVARQRPAAGSKKPARNIASAGKSAAEKHKQKAEEGATVRVALKKVNKKFGALLKRLAE